MSDLHKLAQSLSVTVEALDTLGVYFTKGGWLIPERDATGQITGYARRLCDGQKSFVNGGRRGLTYVHPLKNYAGSTMMDPVFVVEGMSDTAAGLSMDLDIVGRPSANSGAKHLIELLHDRHVCIIEENDETGRKGAKSIAEKLVGCCTSVRIISPPAEHKDLRSWYSAVGVAKNDLLLAAAEAAEFQPEIQTFGRRLVMRTGSSIDDGGMNYLWRRRIPLGGPTIIFSRPGAGKSTMAADMAGNVTTGKSWPDGAPCSRGRVLYLKGEGTDASIRDRMRNAGADPNMYHVIGRADVGDDDESPMIDLGKDDANLLAHELRMLDDVKLVIVDTLDSLFPSMRMIDNGHIRKCLWPMQELAADYDLALVILAHTNKGGYFDPLDRLSGGRAIGGSARAVWYLGQQNRESDQYWMAPVKVNDFKPEPAIEYRIIGIGPDSPGAIRWGESDPDVSAWELDQPPKTGSRSKTEDCVDWMRDRLAGGPEAINPFKVACTAAGFGEYVYKKSRQELGITTKAGKGSVPPPYFACLPGQEPPIPPMPPDHLILDSGPLSNDGVVKRSDGDMPPVPTSAEE